MSIIDDPAVMRIFACAEVAAKELFGMARDLENIKFALWAIFVAIMMNTCATQQAHAQVSIDLIPRIKTTVTLVRGENALTRKEARQVMREVSEIFKTQVEINVTVQNFRVVRAPHALALSTYAKALDNDTLYLWSKRFWKKGYNMGGVIDIAILPTIKDEGHELFAGRSGGFCSLWSGFVINYVGEWRDNGESGLKFSKYVIAHELGHIMGAEHIDTPSIMNPHPSDAMDLYGEIPFDIESVDAIHQCLRQWGRL